MKEINEKSVRQFTEEVGTGGAVMEIRMEKDGGSLKIYASVKKNGREVAFASDTDGVLTLSVRKTSDLTREEYVDLFAKTAQVFGELTGKTKEAEE